VRTTPETSYAQNGDVHIAYQVVGSGARDLVLVMGMATHLDMQWQADAGGLRMDHFFLELADFTRLVLFDKRGTGLSDRGVSIPTLEERMDDLLSVLDDIGSERAVLMGISEGAPLCLLFAACHPERTDALVLYGGMARSTEAPDYPWAPPLDAAQQSGIELLVPVLYSGGDLDLWAPSIENDRHAQEWLGRYRRSSVSPNGLRELIGMFLEVDVRDVLPEVRVPTLVLHRHGDRAVNRRAGEFLAEHIEGAKYVELQGNDHLPWVGDATSVIEEIREFLTGVRVAAEPDRVLSTVMFTDVVSSTETATALGDRRWRELLDAHDDAIRRELMKFRGHEVKTTGDGFLATFDGPARAIRCACAIRAAAGELDLQVRVGLHSGEIEMRGDDIAGVAVVIAQRISALAQANEILVSSTIKDLVAGSGITFSERGQHQLKGVPDEWRLLAVEDI
jgi:class 3 adenylate cyclase